MGDRLVDLMKRLAADGKRRAADLIENLGRSQQE